MTTAPCLGTWHEFDDDCMTDSLTIREILALPDDPPTKHLGEVECIHYIEHEVGGNGIFLTDDHAAADLAPKPRSTDGLRDAAPDR